MDTRIEENIFSITEGIVYKLAEKKIKNVKLLSLMTWGSRHLTRSRDFNDTLCYFSIKKLDERLLDWNIKMLSPPLFFDWMLIFIVGMTSLHCIAPQTTEIQIDDHLLSTPFASIIGKKEYSFSSKNGPKGVLLFPDFQRKRSASLKKKKKFKIFKLALLLLQKSSKRSTPFAPKIDQKEYSF